MANILRNTGQMKSKTPLARSPQFTGNFQAQEAELYLCWEMDSALSELLTYKPTSVVTVLTISFGTDISYPTGIK